MKKTYTKKQITEAIQLWTEKLHFIDFFDKDFLLENQYSHENEIKTAKQLLKIFKDNKSINACIIDNVNKARLDNIIKCVKSYNAALISRELLKTTDVIDANDSDAILDFSEINDKLEFDGLTDDFIIDDKRYYAIPLIIAMTGNSSHTSDCYIVYNDKRNGVTVVGIEMKNSFADILFNISAKVDVSPLNNIMRKTDWRYFDAYNDKFVQNVINLRNIAGIIKNKGVEHLYGKNPNSLYPTEFDFAKSNILGIIKSQVFQDKILSTNVQLLTTDKNKWVAADNTFSYDEVENESKSDQIIKENIKMLISKLIYEVSNASISNGNDVDFIGEITKFFDYKKSDIELFSYKFHVGQASEFIDEYYKNKSTLLTVKINSNDVVKNYFYNDRMNDDTYMPVSYIQMGQNMDYNVYKVNSDNDPLQFDQAGKFKTGNIDDILFGVNCEFGFRSDDTRGNAIRCVGRVYPQTTKRSTIGSILDTTHQVATNVVSRINANVKGILDKISQHRSTPYSSL